MADDQIGRHAGAGYIQGRVGAEQFHPHQDRRHRCVGSRRHHRHQPHCRPQRRLQAEQMGQRATQHRADHELRRHDAAIEARTQRDRHQQRLPQEAEVRHRLAVQRALHQRQAETQIIGRHDQDQHGKQHRAQHRQQRRPQGKTALQGAEGALDRLQQFHEHPRRGAAQDADHHRFQEQQLGEFADEGDVVDRVRHPQVLADLERGDPGDDAGKQEIVPDAADRQHLHAIDRPRDRRAEHAGETRADAARQQPLAQLLVEMQGAADPRRQAGADMRARAFLAGGTAAAQGNHRRQRLDPQRAERHLALLFIHRDDRRILETAATQSIAVVQQQAIGQAASQQQGELRPPRRVVSAPRRGEKRAQEDGATHADHRPGKRRQHQPLQHRRQHHEGFGEA